MNKHFLNKHLDFENLAKYLLICFSQIYNLLYFFAHVFRINYILQQMFGFLQICILPLYYQSRAQPPKRLKKMFQMIKIRITPHKKEMEGDISRLKGVSTSTYIYYFGMHEPVFKID